MGREAEGHARFQGLDGAVRALLESDALVLRGEIRARLSRGGLAGWRVEGEDLCLSADGAALVLTLGAREAAAWVAALDRPPPSLAQKLGVGPGKTAFCIGGRPPEAIAIALAGAAARGSDDAAQIVAVLETPDDLLVALRSGRTTGKPVWCIYRKGPGPEPRDAGVRAAFRAEGWIDSKSTAVDAAWTATRYVIRQG